MSAFEIIPASFRDPSGHVFCYKGSIYRQINMSYRQHYDQLMESGLYEALVKEKLLVSHQEIDIVEEFDKENIYKIIKPEIIPFISYPYEWCFSQLKHAALTTLKIQKIALKFNMTLKDASSYNIQFKDGKPILIDTLSFEKYNEGKPWVAYKQFCQHFLAPLALMSFTDIRLNQLMRIYIDGIPLDLTVNLLPLKTKFNFSLLSHLHLHAATQKKYESKVIDKTKNKLSRTGLLAIIESLESCISKLQWKPQGTEWADYYSNNNYSDEAFLSKKEFINEALEVVNPRNVWDIGANTGVFSRLASNKNIPTISFDIDPAAVEKNYLTCLQGNESNILPLILDITNPSPGIGWQNVERTSLLERGPVDLAFALALIHHLAISNNVPLSKIAELLSRLCNYLIIEYVPKNDSQVQLLLATREDVFDNYTREHFENQFSRYFEFMRIFKVKRSERVLFLMKNLEVRCTSGKNR